MVSAPWSWGILLLCNYRPLAEVQASFREADSQVLPATQTHSDGSGPPGPGATLALTPSLA